jgi:hypothetical protein
LLGDEEAVGAGGNEAAVEAGEGETLEGKSRVGPRKSRGARGLSKYAAVLPRPTAVAELSTRHALGFKRGAMGDIALSP